MMIGDFSPKLLNWARKHFIPFSRQVIPKHTPVLSKRSISTRNKMRLGLFAKVMPELCSTTYEKILQQKDKPILFIVGRMIKNLYLFRLVSLMAIKFSALRQSVYSTIPVNPITQRILMNIEFPLMTRALILSGVLKTVRYETK